MPVHVLYGDSFLVRQSLQQLEAETGAQELLEANTHRLAGAQLKPPELLSICNALPFMDTMRLVLVDGLPSSMESRSGESRSSGGEHRACQAEGRCSWAGPTDCRTRGWAEYGASAGQVLFRVWRHVQGSLGGCRGNSG